MLNYLNSGDKIITGSKLGTLLSKLRYWKTMKKENLKRNDPEIFCGIFDLVATEDDVLFEDISRRLY